MKSLTRSVCLLATLCLLLGGPARSEARAPSDDGRAGTLLDVQGTALVKPAGRVRWTPLSARDVVFPGDRIRLDQRGAHAAEMRLAGGGKLLLGPGTVLELPRGAGPRLLRGELELQADGKHEVTLTGAGDFQQTVKGTAWVTSDGQQTRALEKQPRWVKGYRDSATDEWMGALLAKVDGRDVPLAVGTHAVRVDVRDQIARTTIEETFVNNTSGRLEGVFYFPLPADASISGFGMWIGGELVEADIVEKQRARQIYEDILRRKKDPGLLEWQGGNMFQARVFPIEPHSEKRIRIRYTQVLPLEGDTYRFRYALRSELLRTKPLRQLSIEVRVSSEAPLAEVSSPTHACGIEQTKGEAVVRFDAQEYTPEKDFEVAVRLERAAPLRVMSHKRGEDGYLLMQFTPPDESAGGWQRRLTPEGKPLDLLLVADTSGSTGEGARANQAAFLKSLLAMLGDKDTFRLMAFDVEPVWLEAERLPVTDEHMTRALESLGSRRSLGWSDLDKALAEALAKSDANTTVVFLGDGIGTTGDADPVALADRLRRLEDKGATVHAVAPASTYEQGVLEALASIGGGSVRKIESDALLTASALLSEVARPTLKDLRVSITGIRTARVYPETLPNLPVGQQQVLLGRFLPSSTVQRGSVRVEGTLDGKPVSFDAAVVIPAADGGNDFLPRLWARKHLDHLLSQGRTPEVKQEIVEFSERFGIMTPYTSFLVLESDEDREKYGVARRVRMRDGERFFAEGTDKVLLEMRRKALQEAGQWRSGLRRPVLQEIADLGRSLPIAHPPQRHSGPPSGPPKSAAAWGGPANQLGVGGGAGGSFGGRKGGGRDRGAPAARRSLNSLREEAAGAEPSMDMVESEKPMGESAPAPAASPRPMADPSDGPDESRAFEGKDKNADGDDEFEEMLSADEKSLDGLNQRLSSRSKSMGRRGYYSPARQQMSQVLARFRPDLYQYLQWPAQAGTSPGQPQLVVLGFPALPHTPTELAGEPAEPDWPDRAKSILRSLWRRPALQKVTSGVHLHLVDRSLHPTRGSAQSEQQHDLWLAPGTWWRTIGGVDGQPFAAWVDAEQRGALQIALRLARTRDVVPLDASRWDFPLWSLAGQDLMRGYAGANVTVEDAGEGLVKVTLRWPQQRGSYQELLIHEARAMIVEWRQFQSDQLTHRVVRGDPVQVAGLWWPQRIETRDAKDRVVQENLLTVTAMEKGAVAQKVAAGRTAQADVLTVHGPLPTEEAARQARHEKRATLLDELRMLLFEWTRQQWDAAEERLAASEALVPGKEGWSYVRANFLRGRRAGERFHAHLTSLATRIAPRRDMAGLWLGQWISGLSQSGLGRGEQLALLDSVDAAWRAVDLPLSSRRALRIDRRRASLLQGIGRAEEARTLRARIAKAYPFEVHDLLAHAQDVWSLSEQDAATALLEQALTKREPWMEGERNQIGYRLTDYLWQRRQLDRLQAVLRLWLSHEPRDAGPWMRDIAMRYLRGDLEQADAHVAALLADRPDQDASPAAWARVEAGVRSALGEGWMYSLNRVETQFHAALRSFVRHYASQDAAGRAPISRIWSHYRYRRTEAWRLLEGELLADLRAAEAIETMSFERLQRYVSWIRWNGKRVQPEDAADVIARLETRAAAGDDEPARYSTAQLVLRVRDARREKAEAADYVRKQLAAASELRRVSWASNLWNRLLQLPPSDAHKQELFTLLPKLMAKEATEDMRRAQMAQSLRTLSAKLYAWEFEEARGDPAKRAALSRAEQKAHDKDARKTARGRVVARLKAAALDAPAVARPWIQIERIGYAAEWAADLESVRVESAGILTKDWATDGDPLDRLLRERAAATLSHVCIRRAAKPEWVEEALALLEKGRRQQDARLAQEGETFPLLDWRYQVFRLLIAHGDSDALRAQLESWIVPAKVEARWRIALGYLDAEAGRLAEAIQQFESVQSMNVLDARDLARLSDWYLAAGRDSDRERALEKRYEATSEWTLANQIDRYTNSLGRNGEPVSEIQPEILRKLRVLLRKASWPGNHIGRTLNLYRKTKDFRSLESLVDGLVGHSRERLYNCLQTFGNQARNIHEEATCDALVARIETVLAEEERTVLEKRALHLMIALTEQRASQIKETDPAHGERALAALRKVPLGEWTKGERRLMANVLANIRFGDDKPFVAEQLKQARALYEGEPADSPDRLPIAQSWATIHYHQQQYTEAIDRLRDALEERRARTGGTWQNAARGPLQTLISWMSQRGLFRAAETLLLAEHGRVLERSRKLWLEDRLASVYIACVGRGGAVALGQGRELFDNFSRRLDTALGDAGQRFPTLLSQYTSLHQAAQGQRKRGIVPNAGAMLEAWASQRLPGLLERFPLSGGQYMSTVANTVVQLRGHRAGLRLLVERAEAESPWIRRIDRDVWHQNTWQLMDWRKRGGAPGELGDRLWKLVRRGLEEHLIFGSRTGNGFWTPNSNRYFWAERRSDFLGVASDVLELQGDKIAIRLRVAYLRRSLGQGRLAIETLMSVLDDGVLDRNVRRTLTRWLLDDRRASEALPIAQGILEEERTALRNWLLVAEAEAESGAKPAALVTLKGAETHFREAKKWTAYVAAKLAGAADEYGFGEDSVTWWQEAIRIRTEQRGYRGGRDGTLAGWYVALGRALGRLGRTDEAVSALRAGLVAGSRSHGWISSTLGTLKKTFEQAKDLDAWVATYEAEVEAEGLDVAMIRRTLGAVYQERKQWDAALHHWTAARDLEPMHADTHAQLVRIHDARRQPAAAVEALFGAIRLAPRETKFYEDLARRYAALGDAANAERAYTTLVESTPNQMAGHRRLAQIRAGQSRREEAVVQWRQVVRTDPLNPNGHIDLAEALIAAGEQAEARQVLEDVIAKDWEARFDNVKKRARTILKRMEK